MTRSLDAPSFSGWSKTIRANAPIPVVLALFAAFQYLSDRYSFNDYYMRIVMLAGFNILLAVGLQLINGISGQFSLGHAGFMAVGAYLAAYPAKFLSRNLTQPGSVLWFYTVVGALLLALALALFVVLIAMRASKRIHRSVPIVLMTLLFGWIMIDFAQSGPVWTRGALALADTFARLINYHATVGPKLLGWLPLLWREPTSFIILLIGGGLCAAAAGLVVGLPTLRLRGDYLAIATLGFAEIIRIVIQNSQPLGGALGLTNLPKYTTFTWLYGCAFLATLLIWRLAHSPKGRAIMAVREDEIAAAAMGVDPTHHKVVAFVIGSFLGGVAGALWALRERSITPTDFNLTKSIGIVVIVTLGGLGSISGAIVAAIVLTVLLELLRPIGNYRMIFYSLLLVVMMLLRPQGLLGGRELWPRRFSRRAAPDVST